MKVSTILIILFFLVGLIASISGTSYHYSQTNKVVEGQVYEHLESFAQSRGRNIETLLDNKKVLIRELTLIGKVGKVLLDSSEEDILAVNERLQKTVDSIEEIQSISVVDKSGIIIAGTNSQMIGKDKSNDERFLKAGSGEIAISEIHFSSEGKPVLGLASPVNKNNEIIGFIFMRINIESSLFPLLLDKTGLGETGETYLVNSEGYAITPLLFVEDAVLKWKIDTINSRNCFSHEHEKEVGWVEHEEIQKFLNYKGEKVIGGHDYIPEMKWCLLAEIDEAEILGKQRVLFQKTALTIIISIVIIVTLIGFFIGKFIDERVVLKKGKKSL